MIIFWISILAAIAFAFWVFKQGFYEIWILLFNIVIAVYIAITTKPAIYKMFSSSQDESAYTNALIILLTAGLVFGILQSISYIAFTSQFSIPFPKIFDTFASGLVGFLAGMLICSFAIMLICITPISQNKFAKSIGLTNSIDQKNIVFVCSWCGIINKFAGKSNNDSTTKTIIEDQLFQASVKKKKTERIVRTVEARLETKEEPNLPEPNIPQDNTLGPPPEPEVEDF